MIGSVRRRGRRLRRLQRRGRRVVEQIEAELGDRVRDAAEHGEVMVRWDLGGYLAGIRDQRQALAHHPGIPALAEDANYLAQELVDVVDVSVHDLGHTALRLASWLGTRTRLEPDFDAEAIVTLLNVLGDEMLTFAERTGRDGTAGLRERLQALIGQAESQVRRDMVYLPKSGTWAPAITPDELRQVLDPSRAP